MSFQDKVVIVTGASSGIGETTAKLFAKEKAKVVLVGRNNERLNKVAEDMKTTHETNTLIIKADVTNDKEAISVVEKTISQFKKVDVLINSAGIGVETSIFSDNYVKNFDDTIAVNLRAAAVLIHAATPHLIKTKGNVVNVSSIASMINIYSYSNYAISKAGLDHLTRCLALELSSHGVRINTINPGPVLTDIAINAGLTKEESDKAFELYEKTTPLKRLTEREEVGNVILFLASDKAKSVTGSSYTIDGGAHLVY